MQTSIGCSTVIVRSRAQICKLNKAYVERKALFDLCVANEVADAAVPANCLGCV